MLDRRARGAAARTDAARLLARLFRRERRLRELALVLVLMIVAPAVERDARVGLAALAIAASRDALHRRRLVRPTCMVIVPFVMQGPNKVPSLLGPMI